MWLSKDPDGASQVALVVKNIPANAGDIRDAYFILGWEDPLKKGMATHSSILAWRIPVDRGAWRATVHGVAESDTTEQLSRAQTKHQANNRKFTGDRVWMRDLELHRLTLHRKIFWGKARMFHDTRTF